MPTRSSGAGGPRLRPARTADAAAVASIAAATLPEAWSRAAFAQTLATPSSVGWVALDPRARVIGYVLGRRAADELEITSIAVEGRAQGQGVGRALLDALLEQQRQQGARAVFLEVRGSNDAARGLYAAAGFARRGERAAYYRDGESALVLGRAL